MIEASVIIPTYNQAKRLHACLDSLSRQTQPASSFEVVVAVDGSTDDTLQMLSAYQAPFRLRVIPQQHQGQCAALNHGAEAAEGRICIFLDDDIAAAPQLVEEHVRLHSQQEAVIGIGKISLSLPPGSDGFVRSFAREWENHNAALEKESRPPTWQDCFGGNMSVARSAFLAVGGNAIDLARAYDLELAYRLTEHGGSIVYLAAALGVQDQRKGFRELISDAEKSGAACVELSRRHPPMLSSLLGSFSEQRPLTAALLRALLALNLSPSALGKIHRFIGKWFDSDFYYQLLHRYGFWRGVKHASPDADFWKSLIQGVPILMYHAFGAPGERPGRYIIPINQFKRQMAWLKWRGYHVLGLQEYVKRRVANRLPPPHSVILTIDDGYAETYNLVLPILRRYGFPATVFLVTQNLGSAMGWDHSTELSGRSLLSWQNIREMNQGGIDFGAHSRTHPDLTLLSPEQAFKEIAGSKEDLEECLENPAPAFCYPYGKYSRSTQSLVEKSGFLSGCSIDIGKNTLATSLQALRRVEIRGTDSLLQFALSVHYGLDRQNLARFLLRRQGSKS